MKRAKSGLGKLALLVGIFTIPALLMIAWLTLREQRQQNLKIETTLQAASTSVFAQQITAQTKIVETQTQMEISRVKEMK